MNRLLLLSLFLLACSAAALAQSSPVLTPKSPVGPFFFSAPATTASAAPVQKPGYKFREEWTSDQTTTNFYGSTDSARYEYDASGNEISYILYIYQTATKSFLPFERMLRQFGTDNRLEQATYSAWREDKWIETKKYHYKYSNGSAPDSVIEQTSNFSTGPWTNFTLTTTRKDSNGEVTEWLFHVWRNNAWEPSMGEKHIRTGLTNGQFHEEIYQVYRTTGWSDTKKTVNTFTDGRVTERVEYLASGGNWNPSSRYANFVYGSASEHADVAYTRYVWSNNAWTEITRYHHFTQPDQTSVYTEETKLSDGTWKPQLTQRQGFNASGQPYYSYLKDERNFTVLEQTDSLFYNMDGTLRSEMGLTLRNDTYAGRRTIRYGDYVTVTSPTAVPREKTDIAVLYPNPTQHTVYITPHAVTGKTISVALLDAQGRLLLKHEFREQEKITLDLGHHPAGLYFIRVTQEQKVQTHKVLKR
ncbi:T9SS type A sorting domain-containing protein [Botryobacter ruber]|uniref:T9SS type A sorting domain-containing protein n=1 Tax=Botryobacter ruber TaxID=2171629 RepID=UPI000E0C095B|nr:T9SS type A sorting domain-containing protein [Botryobacter ruber]